MRSRSLQTTVCLAAIGGVLGACTLEQAGPGDGIDGVGGAADTEKTAVQSADLDAAWTTGPFHWQQNWAPVELESADTHVCVLTRVRGSFEGDGEKVRVFISANKWFIGGASQQSGVAGSACCFRKSGFLAPGPARWNSSEFTVGSVGGCSQRSVNTWAGDAVTFVSGVQGRFAGGGELAKTTQSISPSTASQLIVQSCSPSIMDGYAYSFFAGQPGGVTLARFQGPNGVGNAATAGTYSASAPPGYLTPMTPTDTTMCHFVKISGDFNGAGEFAEILHQLDGAGVDRWYLRTSSGSGGGVNAQARCYLRNQNVFLPWP